MNRKVRLPMYFAGLFIMTIGIAISVKSNLGVSPVSSLPYTITCVWGIEMGKATILFHCGLVLIQILLLRTKFKPKNLLQVLIGVVFGYFTTFCNWMVAFLPTPDNIVIRLIMMLFSAFFIAFGIFLYLPPDIMPLAGEGTMSAVSQVTKIEFSKVKIAFDISMVTISLITCLFCIHSLGSVGIGTIIASVLVGTMLGYITKFLAPWRDSLLYIDGKKPETAAEKESDVPAGENLIITISREYGSCGDEIGMELADKLGIGYFNARIIHEVATLGGMTDLFVEKNEQKMGSPALQRWLSQYVATASQDEVPMIEKLYAAEKTTIRQLADSRACVIVGRLGNHILKDYPNAVHIFIGADEETKIKNVMEREHLDRNQAKAKIHEIEKERKNYCSYFAHTNWNAVENYDIALKSDWYGVDGSADILYQMIQKQGKNKANELE